MEDNRSSGLAVGLLLGVAIGVTLGMLYAPKSGEENRRMLADRAKQMRDSAEDAFDKVKETTGKVRERIMAVTNPNGMKS